MRRFALAATVAVLLGSAVAAPSAASAVPDEYAALGDSYSAGNGAYSTDLDPFCGRNTYAYPYLVSTSRPNTHLTFVACQGATTSDVMNSRWAR